MHSRIAKVIDTSKAEKMGIDLEMADASVLIALCIYRSLSSFLMTC